MIDKTLDSEDNSVLKIFNSYNGESMEKLDDGKYITNHFAHEKGVREREVEIKDGSVITDNFSFSQSSFFDVNYLVKRL